LGVRIAIYAQIIYIFTRCIVAESVPDDSPFRWSESERISSSIFTSASGFVILVAAVVEHRNPRQPFYIYYSILVLGLNWLILFTSIIITISGITTDLRQAFLDYPRRPRHFGWLAFSFKRLVEHWNRRKIRILLFSIHCSVLGIYGYVIWKSLKDKIDKGSDCTALFPLPGVKGFELDKKDLRTFFLVVYILTMIPFLNYVLLLYVIPALAVPTLTYLIWPCLFLLKVTIPFLPVHRGSPFSDYKYIIRSTLAFYMAVIVSITIFTEQMIQINRPYVNADGESDYAWSFGQTLAVATAGLGIMKEIWEISDGLVFRCVGKAILFVPLKIGSTAWLCCARSRRPAEDQPEEPTRTDRNDIERITSVFEIESKMFG